MKVVKVEFGAMMASELTPRMIDAWLTEHSDWAPATKNRYRALISLVYRQAMRLEEHHLEFSLILNPLDGEDRSLLGICGVNRRPCGSDAVL
jgi:hypothetical protein